jgi:hypothetical protein
MIKDAHTLGATRHVLSKLKDIKRVNKDFNEFIERLNSLAPDKQVDFIHNLISFQFTHAHNSLREDNDISLIGIGTFKINRGTQIYLDELDIVAKEKGYLDYYHVPGEHRRALKKEAKLSQKDKQYANKRNEYANRGGGKVVLPNAIEFINPKISKL